MSGSGFQQSFIILMYLSVRKVSVLSEIEVLCGWTYSSSHSCSSSMLVKGTIGLAPFNTCNSMLYSLDFELFDLNLKIFGELSFK